jgi:hypothetical protein
MRRGLARTPPEREPGSRSRHAAGRRCTTRRGNAHRTDHAEERKVLYRWHPWAGCIVCVHESVEKVDGTVLRCSRDGQARERWLELPAWMFDRAMCLPMRIVRDPFVEFAALAQLRELLAEAAGWNGRSSSSKTQVSGAASGACDQNRGDDHAMPKSTSCNRSQASPPARSIWFANPDEGRSADPGVASAARRNASVGDGADGAAPPRSQPCRSPSDADGGSR